MSKTTLDPYQEFDEALAEFRQEVIKALEPVRIPVERIMDWLAGVIPERSRSGRQETLFWLIATILIFILVFVIRI